MKTLILLIAASLAAHAAPRTWTSTDGRTINAEYIGRGPDGSALVLERVDTKARVTVPVATLSATDQTFADTLPAISAPPNEAATTTPEKKSPSPILIALVTKWPTLSSTHADAKNLKLRYERDLAAILSGDPAQNCRTLRLRIERDLPIVKNDTLITISPDDQYSEKGRAKIAKVRAAEASISWLKSVSIHAGAIETQLSKE